MGLAEAVLHVDGGIYQLGETVIAAPQVSQQSGVEPTQQTGSPTRVGVDVFRGELGQANESLHVLEYRHTPLLKCTKFPLLELDEARWEIVSPKSRLELIPRDLVPGWLHCQNEAHQAPEGPCRHCAAK